MDLDLASASYAAAFAAALAGMPGRLIMVSAGSAPPSSAAARAAQPAGNLGVAEDEPPELRQHSSRRRRRTCRRRWATRAARPLSPNRLQARLRDSRGPPPQGRREGHQPRVADGGAVQIEGLEPRQGASAHGGGEGRGA